MIRQALGWEYLQSALKNRTQQDRHYLVITILRKFIRQEGTTVNKKAHQRLVVTPL